MAQLFLLKIFLLLILMIAPLPLLAVETIEIGVEDKASPWSMDDGTGFANDVVVAAFAAVNVKAILLTMPYSRCKKEVLRGNVAACLSMSWNDSFEGLIQFSEKPLFSCNSDYYYNVRKPIAATRENQLGKGIIVGIVKGHEYPPAIDNLKIKGVEFVEATSEKANLKRLARGRIHLALINHNDVKSAAKMLADAGVGRDVAFAFNSGILNSYIGFSLYHPQGNWALRKFNKGHKRLIRNGEINKIELKWIAKMNE